MTAPPRPTPPPIATRTDDLSRDFGNVRAVDGLTLEVPSGIVFGFLGPNGSGKTTTIRLLLGLIQPTGGRASVLGIDTRRDADGVRARCGALLEHPGLYERLSAEENLDYYARIWRLSAAERKARVRSLLQGIGLWERRTETVGTGSRGMKQKLAVARALVHRPELLFLDEPTAGLDPVASAALREDLARLAGDEGVTVFLNTHNLPEAEKLCAQIGVIRYGRLLVVAPPGELRERMGGNRLTVSGEGITTGLLALLRAQAGVLDAAIDADGRLAVQLSAQTPTPPIVTMLVENGVQVGEVHRGAADLEAAFLSLMEGAEEATA